jgi:hypothetical protein
MSKSLASILFQLYGNHFFYQFKILNSVFNFRIGFHKDEQVPRKVRHQDSSQHHEVPPQLGADPTQNEQQLQHSDPPQQDEAPPQDRQQMQHGELLKQLQKSGLLQQLMKGGLLQQVQHAGHPKQHQEQLHLINLPLQHGDPPKVIQVVPLGEPSEDQEEECHPENNLTNFESKIGILCLFCIHITRSYV